MACQRVFDFWRDYGCLDPSIVDNPGRALVDIGELRNDGFFQELALRDDNNRVFDSSVNTSGPSRLAKGD